MTKQLNLENFFPYQLAKLQAMVSNTVADIYMGEFNLSKQEWRVLAILANQKPMNAKEIGDKADLEKMPASRAIKKMIERALLEKIENTNDKRSSLLTLSEGGKSLYQKLAPLVKIRENELLSVLSRQELTTINCAFEKLQEQAKQIIKQTQ